MLCYMRCIERLIVIYFEPHMKLLYAYREVVIVPFSDHDYGEYAHVMTRAWHC